MTIVRRSIVELGAATNVSADVERGRLDAMTDAEIDANALTDPNNPLWTDDELAAAKKARSLRKLSLIP